MASRKRFVLTRYRLRTALVSGGRVGAAVLAAALTAHDLVEALEVPIPWLSWVTTLGLVFAALVVAVTVGTLQAHRLRRKVYAVDATHSLTIVVSNFLQVVNDEAYKGANIAFGANDRFSTQNLVTGSLHAEIFARYFDPRGADTASGPHAASTREVEHAEEIRRGLEKVSVEANADGRYPYGTVAVLPIADDLGDPADYSVQRHHPRWAYLVANSTWGTHSFSASGNVRAATNPLRQIYDRHLQDGDASGTLLVPLIGTGQSSAVSSMASLITLIDEYFDQRTKSLERLGEHQELDPIANVVISLQESELQSGKVDLSVVHRYAKAKLAAFAAR